jgi:hypothetical protein
VRMARNYGPLKRGEVYVRRGSHTDPQRPATAAEIQQMIDTSRPRQADLVVEFADLRREASLGAHLTWETEYCRMPEKIPNYRGERERVVSERVAWMQTINDANRDYYRDFAKYEYLRRLLQPTRFLIRNVGRVPAQRVRIEFVVADVDGEVEVLRAIPGRPRSRGFEMSQVRSRFVDPGAIEIETDADGYRLVIDCGDLQPGRPMLTSRFYGGRITSGDIEFVGRIFADNLQRPVEVGVCITAQVRPTEMTLNTLCALADQNASKR